MDYVLPSSVRQPDLVQPFDALVDGEAQGLPKNLRTSLEPTETEGKIGGALTLDNNAFAYRGDNSNLSCPLSPSSRVRN